MTDRSTEQSKPIDLIYVMSSGRSGSTLLSSILATQESLFSAGEIFNYLDYFRMADERDRECSCGARLLECEFWRSVRKLVRDQVGDELIDLKSTAGARFIENNYVMLDAVRSVSGCNIIIDSSKRHQRLQQLMCSDLFNITIVHLLRDPRAYAYSSMLTEMKKGASHSVYYRKLLAWQKKNLGIRHYYGRHPGYIQVRYEDVITDMERQISRIMYMIGRDADISALERSDAADSHEFSGNKRSKKKGLSDIRLDTRYIDNLTTPEWVNASLLVSPATTKFGYPLIRRRLPA